MKHLHPIASLDELPPPRPGFRYLSFAYRKTGEGIHTRLVREERKDWVRAGITLEAIFQVPVSSTAR